MTDSATAASIRTPTPRAVVSELRRTPHWTFSEKLLVAVLSGVMFLDALDGSLTQVALPSIGASLHLGAAQLQWIVSAYVLGYGGFLLLGGRCADLFGRKRVLVWGLVALIVASAVGTVVSDGTLLIAARFLKGASAAFTAPAALSILTTSFLEGPHRNRALGFYTAAAACGFTFGLVSGGLLTELTWRLTFGVVVPTAAVLLIAALRIVQPDPATTERVRLDLAGALTITGAALLFVRAVVEGPTAGWLSAQTVLSVVIAAALVIAFVIIERRVAYPLVRLSLLRSKTLVRANVGALLLFGSATAFNVINMLYEQDVLGWGPLKTGLVFMVASVSTGLVAPRAGAIATRFGATAAVAAGAVALLGSYSLFLFTGVTTSYPVIVASLVLTGAGFALTYPALNIQALAGVRDDEQGLASGLVGSSFQIGGAVVLALSTAATLAYTPSHANATQTVHGLHAGMGVSVAGAALIVLIAGSALRRKSRERQQPDADAVALDMCEAAALENAA